MKGRSASIFALIAIAIVAIAWIPTSYACVSAEDPYSVEVLLNKPGLSYDLSTLKRAENVVDVNPELIGVSGEVVVYKAHYHEDLVAVLYESVLYESGIETEEEVIEQPALSPHLEPLTTLSNQKQTKHEQNLTPLPYHAYNLIPEPGTENVMVTTNISVTFSRPPQIVELEMEPEVEISHMEKEIVDLVSGRFTFYLAKPLQPETIYTITITYGQEEAPEGFSSTSTTSWQFRTAGISGKEVKEQSQEQEKQGKEKMQTYLSVRLTPKVHEVTEYRYKTKTQISKTVFEPHQNFSNLTTPEELQILGWTIKQSGIGCIGDECSYSYSADYKENGSWIKINFLPPQRTRGGIEIDIETNKELNEELKNEILNEISSMFYLSKPDFQKITDALHSIEKEEMKVPEPVFYFNDEEAKEALKTELEWLSNTGIVKGLTGEDIQEIKNSTKIGYAGYNSRIFYEDGKWIPYTESENPEMTRVKAVAVCSFSLKGIQIPTQDVVL